MSDKIPELAPRYRLSPETRSAMEECLPVATEKARAALEELAPHHHTMLLQLISELTGHFDPEPPHLKAMMAGLAGIAYQHLLLTNPNDPGPLKKGD